MKTDTIISISLYFQNNWFTWWAGLASQDISTSIFISIQSSDPDGRHGAWANWPSWPPTSWGTT